MLGDQRFSAELSFSFAAVVPEEVGVADLWNRAGVVVARVNVCSPARGVVPISATGIFCEKFPDDLLGIGRAGDEVQFADSGEPDEISPTGIS